MHTKSELEGMSVQELEALANSLGLKPSKSAAPKDLIYDIIDEESLQNSRGATDRTPKKRGRKPKNAETSEKPVTEAQNTAETPAPKKRGRKPKAEKQHEAENAAPAKVEAPAATEEKPAPKKRGRKSKAEKEAEMRALAEKAAAEQATQATAEVKTEVATIEARIQPEEPEIDFIIIKDIPNLRNTNGYHSNPDEKSTAEDKAAEGKTAEAHIEVENRATAKAEVKAAAGDMADYDFEDTLKGDGVLEVMSEGHGFLRSSDYNYMPAPDDIYITPQQIRQWTLKTGDVLAGSIKLPRDNERYFTMPHIELINGRKPHEIRDRIAFEHLTPLFPDEKFNLCDNQEAPLSVRVVDMFAPIGKGQRGLIVAQPKTGKTILLKEVANAIAANHPEAYLMVLLIDERPEEVTDMARTVNAEVIASTFDEPAEHHVHVANIVIEKAKRLVESGHDVVIFLDSITRLARAYNTIAPASGKILSGGVDANSLQKPKRFFGAARNIEGGGSLTIIATALIDTGSKMDEVIFEEFKGTGNMELQLDRQLANKRIFPAVNIIASSTRRDDMLHNKITLDRTWILRNMISEMTPTEAMTFIKERMETVKDNEEFLLSMGK